MTVMVQAETERRGTHRARVLKGAVLRFNRGYAALDAVMRNQSDGGAQLAMGDTSGVPGQFQLHVSGEEAARTARVVWRNPARIGIAFTA
ncbi:MAG: PilZ domain-containing protein [Notoacmeibacter sp.]|nr:PilZ domain-containing protein [Notoacmeibacter sp.]MCC0032116.1 PilZ domain-containing protein [Brucellaceae bacterium]